MFRMNETSKSSQKEGVTGKRVSVGPRTISAPDREIAKSISSGERVEIFLKISL